MTRIRVSLILAGVALQSACFEPIAPLRLQVGVISADTRDLAGTPVLRPVAVFYRAEQFPVESGLSESCVVSPYSAGGGAFGLATIRAGNPLTATVGATSFQMNQIQNFEGLTYGVTGGAGVVAFTPGDQLTVTIPGTPGEFPAATIQVRTAEPFDIAPVPTPASDVDLAITWTAGVAAGSRFVLSLRYGSSASPGTADSQIVCVFNDDGAATVPANVVGGWVAAQAGSRSVYAARVRQTVLQVNARTQLTLYSFFDRPLEEVVLP